MLDLFRSGVAGHEQPFYYHALVLILGCLPALPLALPGLLLWRTAGDSGDFSVPLHQAMLVLFWVVLLVFSLSTTKIIHYSSLAYVPLAYLAADYCAGSRTARAVPPWLSWVFGLQVLFWFLLLGSIPWFMCFKEMWLSEVRDIFVQYALRDAMTWSGWEFLWVLPLPILSWWGWNQLRQNRLALGVLSIGFGIALVVMGLTFSYLPRIASVTQTPAVAFYQSMAGHKVYVGTLGFKSYAPYFYQQIPFDPDSGVSSIPSGDELLHMPMDRPVFVVTRVDRLPDTSSLPLVRHYAKGGYVVYQRMR
jgi:hypothetical protein